MKDPVARAIRAIARRNSSGIELRGKRAPVLLWPIVAPLAAAGRDQARGEPVAD